MVYTVTLNPSLDYIVHLNQLKVGEINRSRKEEILPGGKGINVSILLSNLHVKTTALGFIAGFVGAEITKRLNDLGCQTDFIPLQEGESRINVKILEQKETEVNGRGPQVQEENIRALFEKFSWMKCGDLCVLSGSVPPTMPNHIYLEMSKQLMKNGCKLILDTTGEAFMKCLSLKPFLVKPNHIELGDLFGVRLENIEDILVYAKKLQDMGAQNVLVSMGAKGALFLNSKKQSYFQQAPTGKVYNTVGAGDSMIGGYIYGLKKEDDLCGLRWAVAAGSASAFSDHIATKEEVEEIYFKLPPSVYL